MSDYRRDIESTDFGAIKHDMIVYDTDKPVFTPPIKRKRFFQKFMVSMLAMAVGALFLGIGLKAGYLIMGGFIEAPPEVEETYEPAAFESMVTEPIVIAIDPQTPDFTDVIARVKDSVVSINVTTTRRVAGLPGEHFGAGSGFFFAQDEDYAYIATNHHVVENTTSITISIDDNEEVPAHIVGSEPDYDLAVLAVSLVDLAQKSVPFVIAEIGCSDSMRMGDSVVAIGNAMGAGQTVTKGIISAVDLKITVHNQNNNTNLTLNVIQTDAAVNQGNSGGPLINQYGEVIGIVTAKLFGQGIEGMGYVLPTNDIYSLLTDLKSTGSVRYAWMGIQSYEVDDAIKEMFSLPAKGLLINHVFEDSPAHEAGFMEWDLLVRFDGHVVESRLDLYHAMTDRRPGDEAVVGIYRNGQFIEIVILLGGIAPR